MAIEFPCGACGKQLRVPDGSGGKQAKCPHCAAVARVPTESPGAGAAPSSAPASNPQSGAGFGAPSSGSSSSSNDDDPLGLGSQPAQQPMQSAPQPQKPVGSSYPAGGSSTPYQSPYQASQPGAGYMRPHHGYEMSHRGGLILTLGILSIVFPVLGWLVCCCCPLIPGGTGLIGVGLGLPAFLMGKRDLAFMREGRMDPSGQGMTNGGMICGLIGLILGGLSVAVAILMVILNMIGVLADTSYQSDPFGSGFDSGFEDDFGPGSDPFADDF